LVVLLCLPITVLIAFLGLKLFHQTLNLMTLGGLAVGLGLIIDDVVVTLENIFRHAEMATTPRQAAVDGASEIQKPMIGSSITTMAVFVPMAFLSEITGALFSPLSITLALLLIVSMILAITIVPVIASRLLAGSGTEEPKEHTDGPAARLYGSWIERCLGVPGVVFGIAAGLAILAFGISTILPTGLMPQMDEGAFVLDYAAPAGTPLTNTDRMVRRIEQELQNTPEVAAYSRRTVWRWASSRPSPAGATLW
jgi:multidrug efflux pump subunit AcrB